MKPPVLKMSGSVWNTLLIGAIVISLLLNYRLWNELQGNVELLREANTLTVGTSVRPFYAVAPNGNRTTLYYSDSTKPTVLYFFTPDCTECVTLAKTLDQLSGQWSDQYRFVGVSLAHGNEQNLTPTVEFPVYTNASYQTPFLYRVWTVPALVVVSPMETVMFSWRWRAGETLGSFEEFLRTRTQL